MRGRVVDAATGHGLSRVEMRAGPNAGQNSNRITMTDGDGRYELKGLPAGTYTIIAFKPNYLRTSWGEARVEGPGKRIELKDSHELWKEAIAHHRPGSDSSQIAAEALELAIQELSDRLLCASSANEAEPLSLDAAMEFLRSHSPSA